MKQSVREIFRIGPEGLKNLGLGWTLVAGVIVSVIAAFIGDSCIVILTRGSHAFFVDGLRVSDWKHGILTNGDKLNFISNLLRMLITLFSWAALMFAAELMTWGIRSFLCARPQWISIVFCFCGGLILFGFSLWYARNFYFIHPIPLISFGGGCALFFKGFIFWLGGSQHVGS